MIKLLSRIFAVFILLSWLNIAYTSSEVNDSELWQALKTNNHFAMIRHALAPGNGDPSNFEIGNRDTQRNLSELGRQQARNIGDLFRKNGITQAEVFSSQWFRCMDTAELLDLGEVAPLTMLNSFYQNRSQQNPQTEALAQWLSDKSLESPLVLVTHQVNITALTDVFPSSGEIVIVKKHNDSEFTVLGTIKTN